MRSSSCICRNLQTLLTFLTESLNSFRLMWMYLFALWSNHHQVCCVCLYGRLACVWLLVENVIAIHAQKHPGKGCSRWIRLQTNHIHF
jgi:hypothetical protein